MAYKIQTIDCFAKDDVNLYNEIRELTTPCNASYAERSLWLDETFFPGLKDGSRKIVMALDDTGKLAGVSLLKDTKDEKKICCLFIRQDCRGHGIGGKLIQKSFEVLDTDKPLLTVSDRNYPQFEKLIKLHGFKFSYKKKGAYQETDTEYYFNNQATEILQKEVLAPLFAGAFRKKR